MKLCLINFRKKVTTVIEVLPTYLQLGIKAKQGPIAVKVRLYVFYFSNIQFYPYFNLCQEFNIPKNGYKFMLILVWLYYKLLYNSTTEIRYVIDLAMLQHLYFILVLIRNRKSRTRGSNFKLISRIFFIVLWAK